MAERLTRVQMTEKYPNQWIGIKNPIYKNNDGITLESAEVVYTDKTKNELLLMQITGKEGIIGWYTTDNSIQLGLVGVTIQI